MASTIEETTQFDVRNPSTGAVVERLPVHGADEVAARAAALREAQVEWRALGFDGRARWMHKWRDWYLDHERELTRMVQEESGKSLADASMEVPIATEIINYYAKNAGAWLAPESVKPHAPTMATKRLQLRFSPYQLVGLITPWNGPIGNPMLDLPAALMAGCAVLCKPSEETPVTWARCVKAWTEEIGAPPVLDVVTGFGETGAAVVDSVDMVHFTGSVDTGRRIAVRCAERLIPCSLEMGGKDPMIVCADADLERAAGAAVWGGFTNSGQICISVERVYVEAPVYDRFVALVTEKTRALRAGTETGTKVQFDYGAMANQAQVDIVERHVADATERGARALTGSGRKRDGDGFFIEPTVLVDVDHSMTCMREETFGPTLPIMKVDDLAEAVSLANDTAYGLSASVWTQDRAKGEKLADALEAGAVNINNVFINLFQLGLPQGGWRDSGVGGRLGGAQGIRKYCREKAVVGDRVAMKSEPTWYPASSAKVKLVGKASRFLNASDWRRRLGR